MEHSPRTALICLALSLTIPPAAMAQTPTEGQDCTSLNARYTIEGADGFELRFEKAPEQPLFSDLQAVFTTPTARYVLKLSRSNGYFDNYLQFSDDIVLPDNADSFPFYGFDANLKVTELPQSDTPAAQYYFTPELGSILWYDMPEREFLPKELWHLAVCT